jgi:sugar-specific transcriptional regulator TrmB
MLLDEKVLTTLQRMGLTYYGARAYAALVTMGPSSPGDIAKEAGVPRSKIYEVLKRLEVDGWVKVERGRPLSYRPRRPKEAIEERKATLFADVEYVSSELSSIYDRHIDRESPKVWLIRGMDNISARIVDMMARAKYDIVLLGALYSAGEIERIKKQMERARKKGVSVRIITRPSIELKSGDIDLIGALSGVVPDIKLYKTPFIKFVVIDSREILIMFSKVTDDVPDVENAIAIWTPNNEVASLMQSNFNMMWDVAKSVKAPKGR